MGKSTNSPDIGNSATKTADTATASKLTEKFKPLMTTTCASAGGVNVLIYMLCVTSLGFSVYTSVHQTQLEDRIREFHQFDDRISVLEAKLRLLPMQFLQSLSTLPSTTTSDDFISMDTTNQSTISNLDDTDDVSNEFSHILRKLSVQMSGIQRLRRDVTYLKASRRGERQASVQQSSECMCPPGKSN